MYQIAFPKTEQDNDFTFIFGNDRYTVDILMFSCYSEFFQENISLVEEKEYKVELDVSTTSFKNFLNACQGKAFPIDHSNAYDLLLLCDEFKTTLFKEKIKDYYDKHENEILLAKLSSSLSNKDTAYKVISEIADKIKYMDEDQRKRLFDLDLDEKMVLALLNGKGEDLKLDHLIYHYIKKKVGRDKKSKFKDLFGHIDLRALTIAENIEFARSEAKPEYYQSEMVFPFIEYILVEMERQQKEIKKLSKEVAMRLNDYKNAIEDIHSSSQTMQTEVSKVLNDFTIMDKDCTEFIEKSEEYYNDFLKFEAKSLEIDSERLFPLELKVSEIEKKVEKTIIKKNPFDGIFNNLYIMKDSNPAGTDVFIKTPIQNNPNFRPSNLLEYSDGTIDDCYYHNLSDKKAQQGKKLHHIKTKSENTELRDNNWIEFDFTQDFTVELIGYTIRTNTFGETFSHPKDFKIEGGNEDNVWETIDERKNATELNGARKFHTYILDEYSKPFHKIRFVQLDSHFPYKDRDKIMALSAIELHGKRKPVSKY